MSGKITRNSNAALNLHPQIAFKEKYFPVAKLFNVKGCLEFRLSKTGAEHPGGDVWVWFGFSLWACSFVVNRRLLSFQRKGSGGALP